MRAHGSVTRPSRSVPIPIIGLLSAACPTVDVGCSSWMDRSSSERLPQGPGQHVSTTPLPSPDAGACESIPPAGHHPWPWPWPALESSAQRRTFPLRREACKHVLILAVTWTYHSRTNYPAAKAKSASIPSPVCPRSGIAHIPPDVRRACSCRLWTTAALAGIGLASLMREARAVHLALVLLQRDLGLGRLGVQPTPCSHVEMCFI